MIVLQHKCIEPLGESRSDWHIFADLAARMGLAAPYAEGSDEFEWVRRTFEGSDLPKHISWREFLKKGYYVVPPPAPGLPKPVAYRWFAEGRPKDTLDLQPLPGDYAGRFGEGLQTQSGKIEFVSSSLMHFDPDDPERPPMSRYVPSWEGPADEGLAGRYPLQLVSPHPRFSHHTLEDGKDCWTNDVADHRVLVDGRYYWIARLNADDAAARGIADGDLMRLFNDRGAVVCAARLDAAAAARRGALVRIVRSVRTVRRAGFLHRPGRLRQPAHAQPPHRRQDAQHGAELVPRGSRALGWGRSLTGAARGGSPRHAAPPSAARRPRHDAARPWMCDLPAYVRAYVPRKKRTHLRTQPRDTSIPGVPAPRERGRALDSETHPPVDHQHLPGDVPGLVAGEEQDCLRLIAHV